MIRNRAMGLAISIPCGLFILLVPVTSTGSANIQKRPCTELPAGLYTCYDDIDSRTQQLRGCQPEGYAPVVCVAVPKLVCAGLQPNGTFIKHVPCKPTNGYSYEISLVLSVFLGMFGIDRFYLGYPAIGILKLCTLGGFFVFQLIDMILIASGTLKPADGSHYVIPYYGPGIDRATFVPGRSFVAPAQYWLHPDHPPNYMG